MHFTPLAGLDVSGWMRQWTLSPNYPVLDASIRVDRLPNGSSTAALKLRQSPVVLPAASSAAPAAAAAAAASVVPFCNDTTGEGLWWVPISAKPEVSGLGGRQAGEGRGPSRAVVRAGGGVFCPSNLTGGIVTVCPSLLSLLMPCLLNHRSQGNTSMASPALWDSMDSCETTVVLPGTFDGEAS